MKPINSKSLLSPNQLTTAFATGLFVYSGWISLLPANALAAPATAPTAATEIPADSYRYQISQSNELPTEPPAGQAAETPTETPASQSEEQLPQLETAPASPIDSPPSPASSLPVAQPGLENAYILGPGDQIRIEVYGAPEYSGDALVLADGALTLPTAGRIDVQGLSLAQAEALISQQYSPFIHQPRVTVIPTVLRPVSLGIVGAVKRPGTYTIPIQSPENNHFPTLTDAIRLAGGIDSQADIRQIEISRAGHSGTKEIIDVNLWALLQNGDMSEDIPLQAGDTISIPTAEVINPEEAAYVGAASFSPEFVTVYIVGEVTNPGPVNVSPNTPLNQAILAAGGFNSHRADNEQIALVRLNDDGTIDQRSVEVDFTSGIDETSNPMLMENDVVVVERDGLASFSDRAGLAMSPIGGFLNSILSIFNLF